MSEGAFTGQRCPIEGCTTGRRPNQLMCRRHWFRVPKDIRDLVWERARRMWAAEEADGLTSEDWAEAHQAWSEARGMAIIAVEDKLAKEAEQDA